MQARLGTAAGRGSQAVAYGETLRIGEVTVTLVPAGHVLGSAQVVIEWQGRRVVVSGDYKRAPIPPAPPYELVPCDLFITEATFALPVFQHGDAREEVAKLLNSRAQFPERAHVVGVYGLGKCQRVIALCARRAMSGRSTCMGRLPSAARSMSRSAWPRRAQIRHGGQARGAQGRDRARAAFGARRPLVAAASRPFTAFASGWMRVRARARQQGVELPLVISDHADWNELVAHHRGDGRRGGLGHPWARGRAALSYPIDGTAGTGARAHRPRGRGPVKAFAELLDRLAYTPSRNDKLRLLARLFRLRARSRPRLRPRRAHRRPVLPPAAPPHPERDARGPNRSRAVRSLPRLCGRHRRDHRAAMAGEQQGRPSRPGLATSCRPCKSAAPTRCPAARGLPRRLDATGRFALLKLITGALRVGVSARLAKTALAEWSGVAARRHRGGLALRRSALCMELFAWLAGDGPAPGGRERADLPAADAVASDRGPGACR